jgi:trans-aconitate methyltransferase
VLGGLLLALVVLAAASVLWNANRLGIGPVPTSRPVRRAMMSLVPSSAATLYELGCGWGGLARAMARRFPSARVIAVEASLVPWAMTAALQRLQHIPNLEVVRGSFWSQPLGEADVLVCYLWTGGMQELAARLRLKPGAVLISATFALPGATAEQTVRADDLYRSPVYRYRG